MTAICIAKNGPQRDNLDGILGARRNPLLSNSFNYSGIFCRVTIYTGVLDIDLIHLFNEDILWSS